MEYGWRWLAMVGEVMSLTTKVLTTLLTMPAVAASAVAALPRLGVPFLYAEIKHKLSFNIVITNTLKET